MGTGINGPLTDNAALNVIAGTEGLTDNEALNVISGTAGPSFPVIIQPGVENTEGKTLAPTDPDVQIFNTGDGPIQVFFPLVAQTTPGKRFFIKNYGSNDLTLTTSGSDSFILAIMDAEFTISPGGSVMALLVGDFWQVFTFNVP